MPGKSLGILALLVEDGIVSRDTWMRMASFLVMRSEDATMSHRAGTIISQRTGSETILTANTTGGN